MNQFAKIAANNKGRMKKIAQQAYVVTIQKVNRRTPVDSGLFKNNWFTALNAPSQQTTQRIGGTFGEPQSNAVDDAQGIQFDIGDTLFLTNSLPYAERLEYGWSAQSPEGMVRISAGEWSQTVNKVIRLTQ